MDLGTIAIVGLVVNGLILICAYMIAIVYLIVVFHNDRFLMLNMRSKSDEIVQLIELCREAGVNKLDIFMVRGKFYILILLPFALILDLGLTLWQLRDDTFINILSNKMDTHIVKFKQLLNNK